jgi:hypothetical protein
MRSTEGESVHTAPRKIGEILVHRDMITEAQLEEALEAQKTDGRSIGKILVSMGYLTTEDLARALSERLNVDYVALFEIEVDPEVRGSSRRTCWPSTTPCRSRSTTGDSSWR